MRPCAAAINAPCPNRRPPSSQSKPTAVDRQKDYSINYGKRLPEPPKSNKKEKKLKKESVRCLHVVSPKPAFACKHAPAHLSTRQIDQCWTATHVDTVNSTRPHELRVISVVLDAKLAHALWPPSRSRVPTMHPSAVRCWQLSKNKTMPWLNGPYSPKGKKWRPHAPGGIMPR